MITDKRINSKLSENAVKCRFFGQYLEQIIAKETKYPNSPTINTTTVLILNKSSNYHLELKEINSENLKFQVEIDLSMTKNQIFSRIEEDSLERESVDYFRNNGFAIPFENYSVEDLISLGWVRFS